MTPSSGLWALLDYHLNTGEQAREMSSDPHLRGLPAEFLADVYKLLKNKSASDTMLRGKVEHRNMYTV